MALRITSGFVVATFIIAAWPAHAEEDPDCRGIPIISIYNLTVGHISPEATRVHFVKDGYTQHGCPDQTPACADKAYLVPGDRLIIIKRRDAFICAIYLNTKTTPRIGWLPADAVAYDMAKPIALTDWVGKWSWKGFPPGLSGPVAQERYSEADIDISVDAKARTLSITGSAALYRLKHEGQMGGEVMPTGGRLSFATRDGPDEFTILPVDEGKKYDCQIWMQRLGRWLIVNDNMNCGGLYVTFSGIYTRKP
jgi:hypothetical protein